MLNRLGVVASAYSLIPKPDARPLPLAANKLNASRLESLLDHQQICPISLFNPTLTLKALECANTNAGLDRQPFQAPTQGGT